MGISTELLERLKANLDQGQNQTCLLYTSVKNGEFPKITREIEAVKKAAGNHVVKVIIETC